MMETISGTYKTTHWQEQEYRRLESGARLSLAEKEVAIGGDIQGDGTLRYCAAQLGDRSRRFTGHMSITGRIGGLEGSFVVEENGQGGADGASGTWKVIPGSGSGDFVGLTGEGRWKWNQGEENVAYSLTITSVPTRRPARTG